MSIGTSLGGYFKDEFEMHTVPFRDGDKDILINPDLDPDRFGEDNIDIPSKPRPPVEVEVDLSGKK